MKRRWYETNPSMIKEYSNNNALSYKEATIAFMAEWTCEKGHIWKAKVGSRMGKRLTGCPYCAGKKPIKGTNDLSTLYPDIAKEWDYEKNDLNPEEYLPSSNKRVGFVCSKGHKWEQKIYVRTRKNASGCPYCAGRKIICGTNDLATLRPDLAREWDYIRNDKGPDEYTKNSGEVVWWNCKKGHQWRSTIANRVKGNGCPFCSGKKPIVGENDLGTLKPELIKEWDYEKNKKKPSECTLHSSYFAWWKCEKNHSWQSKVSHRADDSSGCPYCAGQKAITGENDLVTVNPEWLKEWDYENNAQKPSEYTLFSGKKVWWVCEKGHHFRTEIASRNKKNIGCPYCSGRKVIPGENDLKTLFPEVVFEWDYEKNKILSPEEVSPKSDKSVWWICKQGHSEHQRIRTRVKGMGCKQCRR